jgi:cysteinyl-tRNA synthetase
MGVEHLKIYNTLSRKKEEFVPVSEGEAKIYACGPTVYNYFHIGNARPFVVFDTLRRYLAYRGYRVTFVQNFTDVDDKMINRAREEDTTVKELGERFITEYFKDAQGLNILPADIHPKATEHIEDIIAIIQKLIDKGLAYAVDGDVYYNVAGFEGYGKLSGQSLDELKMGARVDVGDVKKDPMDFALWKAKKEGEISWQSPWGEGRPGWHIECSAMSMRYLGPTFDIHGGGMDLIFPHHENEIAQSEGATGVPFAKYWMHNGYINVDNKKMSKSLGNFFTVRDIAKDYDLAVVRMFLLSAQYRSPINFSRELMEQSKAAFERIKNCRENLKFIMEKGSDGDTGDIGSIIAKYETRFIDAMDDDLNTADALGGIFEMVKEFNLYFTANNSKAAAKESLAALDKLLAVMGLIQKEDDTLPEEVVKLLNERMDARKQKDFKKSDELRDAIKAQGYEVKDTPEGPKITKI